MLVSLIGYMGSGKSHVAKILSEKTGLKLYDLDKEISKKTKMAIPEIFKEKGEIFFRKLERETLEEIIAREENGILSLGGGTPVYYNNIEIINQNTKSVFLQTSVKTLAERLSYQKEKRPLIAKLSIEELPEFIAKHLFERNAFYAKSQFTVSTDGKTPEVIVEEITRLLQDCY